MTEVDHGGALPGIAWPTQPGALVDTSRCPSCFAPITTSPCPRCELDLTDARTARVLDLSRRIVELVDERADALLRIHRDAVAKAPADVGAEETQIPSIPLAPAAVRVPGAGPAPGAGPSSEAAPEPAPPGELHPVLPAAAATAVWEPPTVVTAAAPAVEAAPGSAPAVEAAPDAASPVVAAPAAAASGSVPPSAAVPPVAPPPGVAPPAADPARPRRSGVQVLLLSVGVVLLAVAAAFFLTVAWINGGLVLRSIVIALVTAGVIATASILRRRGLGATAEGIALLGIAFVGLDVWAVRANDLGATADVDAAVYWGATTTVAGLAFVGWARLSRLRAPLSAAVFALAVGPAMLAAGLLTRDAAFGWWAWGLVLVVVALAAPFAPRLARPRIALTVETAIVRGIAALGAIVALAMSLLVDPANTATPVILAGALALALAVHAWSFARQGAARLAPVAAVAAVLALGVGIAGTVARAADATLAATMPVLVAGAVALVLDVAARRSSVGVGRTTLHSAALSAAVAAGLAALVPLGWALLSFGAPLRWVIAIFGRSALEADAPDATSTAAVIALVALVALTILVWRIFGGWVERRGLALGMAATVALLAGPQLRVLLLVVLWYLAIAVTAVVVLRRRRGDIGLAAVVGTLALGTGWLLSFSSPLAWALATVVALGALAAVAGAHPTLRVPSTVAVVLFAAVSALFAPTALRSGTGVVIDGASPFTLALAVATLALLIVVVPLARRLGLDSAQREAGALTALVVVVVAGALALVSRFVAAADDWRLDLAGIVPAARAIDVWLLASAAVAAAACAVVVSPPYRSWRVARPASAVLVPLLVTTAAGAVLRLVDADPLARAVVLGAIAVIAAAVALRALRDDRPVRVFLDAGTAIVVLLSIVGVPSDGVRWIPLLLAAVTAVLWATDADGLFTSRGARRHLVWLALVFGAVALWTRLFWADAEPVELYTLPVGLALLALAAGHERARRLVEGRSAAVPAVIAASGATLALVPTALADPADLTRAVVIALVSVAVLVLGAWLRLPRTPDELPVAVGAAGALALVLLTVSQIGHAVIRPDLGLVDLIMLVTAAAILAAAAGLARRASAWAPRLARAVAVTAVIVFALGETVLVAAGEGAIVRAVGAVALLGALGVVCLRLARPVLGAPLAGAALGGAALVALVGVAADVRPIEWMTVPLALAWVAGALLSRSRPLPPVLVGLAAAGLAVGLLPSAALADSSLVRTLIVVVAAVAVLGAALRLRGALAPLVVPVAAVGSLALALAASLRSVRELTTPLFDVWMLVATVPLLGVAVLVVLRRLDVTRTVPTALIIAAPAVAVVLCVLRLSATGEGSLRLVVTLAAVLAVGLCWRASSATLVFWATFGVAAVLAVAAFAIGAADPVETATAPLAIALVVHGIRSLRSRPALRTWPALGPGLVLLLVPSLLFDFTADNALWRAIALGVVALVVLLAGARLRWQAPVLLAGIVLIVHAVAQLWPWISALYVSASGLLWVWIGIAGAVLIFVAATYERRIRELKAVALAIRSLR
ncbi:SCO7613 C-terminal domain-containing membrane protein [Microbacterium sp. che218]|uniref:SCO7613 C-terminal domain-containing membrane protein n=1 Tax=Microbacterium sp. che218 TaxID=3140649 RepID=UPI003366BD88